MSKYLVNKKSKTIFNGKIPRYEELLQSDFIKDEKGEYLKLPNGIMISKGTYSFTGPISKSWESGIYYTEFFQIPFSGGENFIDIPNVQLTAHGIDDMGAWLGVNTAKAKEKTGNLMFLAPAKTTTFKATVDYLAIGRYK